MTIFAHNPMAVHTTCDCDDCVVGRIALRLGMGDLLELAPADADVPAEYVPTGPSEADERWAIETMPEWARDGCGSDDLSPEEQFLEAIAEPAWDYYARLAEEERLYEEGYRGW